MICIKNHAKEEVRKRRQTEEMLSKAEEDNRLLQRQLKTQGATATLVNPTQHPPEEHGIPTPRPTFKPYRTNRLWKIITKVICNGGDGFIRCGFSAITSFERCNFGTRTGRRIWEIDRGIPRLSYHENLLQVVEGTMGYSTTGPRSGKRVL
jgi:hypothetical protein